MARFITSLLLACTALAFTPLRVSAGVGDYAFTINTAASGLNAAVDVSASTSGTLIGNWDAASNPTGTRTKPGLFGPFGDTENLPVNLDLGLGLTGSPNTHTSGAFGMTFDFSTGLFNMSGFSANLLQSGPAALTAEISLLTETFRTRSPQFLYLGGIPITVPFGQVSLNTLTVTQVGDVAPGILTPLGSERYSFTVAPLVTLEGSIDVLGQTFELPATPVPFPLVGEIQFNDVTALLTSIQPLEFLNTQPLDLTLPQTPLALPTLNPDSPANVLLDLVLSEISASLSGTLTTSATGHVIPEPGTALLLAAIGCAAWARRREH